MIRHIKATDQCQNCGAEFADHKYVPDSITQYDCPYPRQDGGYGFFPGGDPRDFHPDAESCSAVEIENHRRACQLWNEAESRGETPTPEACPSGWIAPGVHVLRSPYGIGSYVFTYHTQFEKRESNYLDDEDQTQ